MEKRLNRIGEYQMTNLLINGIAALVMLSYIVIYKVIQGLILLITLAVYHNSFEVFVEKRDEYLKELKSMENQIYSWTEESGENAFLFIIISACLSAWVIGWVGMKLWEVMK